MSTFDEIEILVPSIFDLWTKCRILNRYTETKKKWFHWSSSSSLSGCAKASIPLFHEVLSPAVESIPMPMLLLHDMWRRLFIASNSAECAVLFTSLQNIVILSTKIIVRAGAKSTNVVCPRNGTYDICTFFEILSKTGFVDIVTLCCNHRCVTPFCRRHCEVVTDGTHWEFESRNHDLRSQRK